MANQQTRQLRKQSSKDPRNNNFACIVQYSSSGTRHDVQIVNRPHGLRAFKFIGNPDKKFFRKSNQHNQHNSPSH